MASITSFYNENKGAVSIVKQYRIPLGKIVVKHEDNLRPLDDEHVKMFADAYLNQDPVPPIRVFINEDNKPQLVEGFHRYAALRITGATATVCDVMPFMTKAKRIALMVNSANGKPLTVLQKADAAMALRVEGLEYDEIAKELHCSKTDAESKCLLGGASDALRQFILDDKASATTVLEYIRKYGEDALKMLTADLERAEKKGKKRLTPGSGGRPAKFSYASLTSAMEILTQADYDAKQLAQEEGVVQFELGVEDAKELVTIIEEYDEYSGE